MTKGKNSKDRGNHSIPSTFDDTLRVLIHQKLDELRGGDLYFDDGLTEKDYGLLLNTESDETFKRFEAVLAKTLKKIEIAKNHKEKPTRKLKEIEEVVRSRSTYVKKQIKSHQQLVIAYNPNEKKSNSVQKSKKQKSDRSEADNSSRNGQELGDENDISNDEPPSVDHSHESPLSPKRGSKKAKKGTVKSSNKSCKRSVRNKEKSSKKLSETVFEKPSEKPPKTTSKKTPSKDISKKKSSRKDLKGEHKIPKPEKKNTEVEGEDCTCPKQTKGTYVESEREKAEREFNLEKRDILNEVDALNKKDFREIGFGKWNANWLPIIQLSPYDIPSGSVRDEWVKMHNKLRKNKLPRAVYWYGTPRDDLTNGFSFLPIKDIVSYEVGMKKDYHKLSDKIKKKLDAGKKLGSNDLLMRDGLLEQATELKFPKEGRVAWLKQMEDYEYIEHTVQSSGQEVHKERQKRKIETEDGDKERKMKRTKTSHEAEMAGTTGQINKKRKKAKGEKLVGKRPKNGSKNQNTDSIVSDRHDQDSKTGKDTVDNLDDKDLEPIIVRTNTNGVIDEDRTRNKRTPKTRRKKDSAKKGRETLSDVKKGLSSEEETKSLSRESEVKSEECSQMTAMDPEFPPDASHMHPSGERKNESAKTKKERKCKDKTKGGMKTSSEEKEKERGLNNINEKDETKVTLVSDGEHASRKKKVKKNKKKDKTKVLIDVSPETEIGSKLGGTTDHNNATATNLEDKLVLKKKKKTVKAKVVKEPLVDVEDKVVKNEISQIQSIENRDDENANDNSANVKVSVKSCSDSEGSIHPRNTDIVTTIDKIPEVRPSTRTKDGGEIHRRMGKNPTTLEAQQEDLDKQSIESFLPVIRNLRSSIKDDKVGVAIENLEFILQNVSLVNISIIKKHKMGLVVTETRKHFVDNQKLTNLCKNVTKSIKKEYKEKAAKKKIRTNKEIHGADDDIQVEKGYENLEDQRNQTPPIKLERDEIIDLPKKKENNLIILPQLPSSCGSNPKLDKIVSQANTPHAHQLPRWMTQHVSDLPVDPSYEGNSDRTFATEFFVMAVGEFSKMNKEMNSKSIARSLETATFQLMGEDLTKYWEKVHAICAAIVGKDKGVTLFASRIIKGHYLSAEEISQLPLKKLYETFEDS